MIAAVLVVCVGGGAAALLFFDGARQERDEARRSAESFVAALQAGDSAGAYAQLCPQTRQQYSRDAFEQRVRGEPAIREHQVRTVTVNTVDRRRRAMVTMDLVFVDGSTARHSYPLSPVDDGWQVCGQPY